MTYKGVIIPEIRDILLLFGQIIYNVKYFLVHFIKLACGVPAERRRWAGVKL